MRATRELLVETPPEALWPLLWDVPRMAACLPGCTDAQEAGAQPEFGGGRNAAEHFDFYDVTHDRQVNLSDVLEILAHFGHGPDDDAADNQLDRHIPDANTPYLSAASDDGVDVTDALANLESFGHDCSSG